MKTYLTSAFNNTLKGLPDKKKVIIFKFREVLDKLDEDAIKKKYISPDIIEKDNKDGVMMLAIKNYRIYCSFFDIGNSRALLLSGIYHIRVFFDDKTFLKLQDSDPVFEIKSSYQLGNPVWYKHWFKMIISKAYRGKHKWRNKLIERGATEIHAEENEENITFSNYRYGPRTVALPQTHNYSYAAYKSAELVQTRLEQLGLDNIKTCMAHNPCKGVYGLIIYGHHTESKTIKKWVEKHGDETDALDGSIFNIHYKHRYAPPAQLKKHDSLESIESTFKSAWESEHPIELYDDQEQQLTGFIINARTKRTWHALPLNLLKIEDK